MKLATLLYIKNDQGKYLLIERERDPNRGLISPPGGKIHIEEAESPAMCAVREAYEECGIKSSVKDWKLIGIVTERSFPDTGNIMIFLFEYLKIVNELPVRCNEGSFHFIHPSELVNYKIPTTDKEFIWAKVLEKSKNPFEIVLDCSQYPKLKEIVYSVS